MTGEWYVCVCVFPVWPYWAASSSRFIFCRITLEDHTWGSRCEDHTVGSHSGVNTVRIRQWGSHCGHHTTQFTLWCLHDWVHRMKFTFLESHSGIHTMGVTSWGPHHVCHIMGSHHNLLTVLITIISACLHLVWTFLFVYLNKFVTSKKKQLPHGRYLICPSSLVSNVTFVQLESVLSPWHCVYSYITFWIGKTGCSCCPNESHPLSGTHIKPCPLDFVRNLLRSFLANKGNFY